MKTHKLSLMSLLLISSLTGCGRKLYTIEVCSEDENKGTIQVFGELKAGKYITVKATPTEYYSFKKWTKGIGSYVTDSNTFTVQIPRKENFKLTARFENKTYHLSIDGDDRLSPTGAGDYKWGDVVKVDCSYTASDDWKYGFYGWEDSNHNILSNSICFNYVMPKEDMTLKALCKQTYYDVNLETSHPGITRLSTKIAARIGDYVYLSADTWGIYKNLLFYSWTDVETGELLSRRSSHRYEMPEHDVYLKATFKKADVRFGEYPQSLLKDSSIIAELNNINTYDEKGYINYGGVKYLRSAGNYYIVEPIEWYVISDISDKIQMVSKKVLDIQQFNDTVYTRYEDNKPIYANNYNFSTIRSWFKNDFYNRAFSDSDESYITSNEDFYDYSFCGDEEQDPNYFHFDFKEGSLPDTASVPSVFEGATDYALSLGGDPTKMLRINGVYNEKPYSKVICDLVGSYESECVSVTDYYGITPMYTLHTYSKGRDSIQLFAND